MLRLRQLGLMALKPQSKPLPTFHSAAPQFPKTSLVSVTCVTCSTETDRMFTAIFEVKEKRQTVLVLTIRHGAREPLSAALAQSPATRREPR